MVVYIDFPRNFVFHCSTFIIEMKLSETLHIALILSFNIYGLSWITLSVAFSTGNCLQPIFCCCCCLNAKEKLQVSHLAICMEGE